MSNSSIDQSRQFQQKIYQDLNEKLKSMAWNGGASEAHGLLTGLACRGTRYDELKDILHLFQTKNVEHISLLEGMYELVVRDLESEDPTFNLLLPSENVTNKNLAFELIDWCEGFFQGYCHDGDSALKKTSDDCREMVEDIIEIGKIDVASIDNESNTDERSLVEIEEYLRMGVQMIYDENVQSPATSCSTISNEIH